MEQTNACCHQESQQNSSSCSHAHLGHRGAGAVSSPPREGSRALPAPRASCQMFSPLAVPSRGRSVIYYYLVSAGKHRQVLTQEPRGVTAGRAKAKPHLQTPHIPRLLLFGTLLGPSLSSFQIKLQQKKSLFSAWLNAFKTSKISCEANYFLDKPPYPCFRLINPRVFHQEK